MSTDANARINSRSTSLRICIAALAVSALGCGGSLLETRVEGTTVDAPQSFAAPGRIEGVTEPIEVGVGIDGVLESVDVNEGDAVAAGQVLARISCQDLQAAISVADAAVRAAGMRLLILRKGTRDEDLDLARAKVAVALASRNRAAQFYERMQKLWDPDRLIPEDELDRAARERDAASASYDAALAEARRAEAGPLREEVAEAEALAAGASHHAIELRNRHAKCEVRAPVAGTVLKKFLLPGEAVSTVLPRPILTLASLAHWTVRAEVDEHDVDRVSKDMTVTVTSPAWGHRHYGGRITTIANTMGRRRVRSGDPAEKSDRDVREVIVQLEGRDFVVGLRVDVRFSPSP